MQSNQSLAICKITKSKKKRKLERQKKRSFKGSRRASATAAGHAFTPPAWVTRISAVDTAHKMSRHRREKPASHVEGSFRIFFKTESSAGSRVEIVGRLNGSHGLWKGTVWRNWPDALWLCVFLQGIVFCVATGHWGDTNRQSMRRRGADSMSMMEWKPSSTWRKKKKSLLLWPHKDEDPSSRMKNLIFCAFLVSLQQWSRSSTAKWFLFLWDQDAGEKKTMRSSSFTVNYVYNRLTETAWLRAAALPAPHSPALTGTAWNFVG